MVAKLHCPFEPQFRTSAIPRANQKAFRSLLTEILNIYMVLAGNMLCWGRCCRLSTLFARRGIAAKGTQEMTMVSF